MLSSATDCPRLLLLVELSAVIAIRRDDTTKVPRAVKPVPTARGWLGYHVVLPGAPALALLSPFDFGEPAGDMGMLRIELAGLMKGRYRFGKFSL